LLWISRAIDPLRSAVRYALRGRTRRVHRDAAREVLVRAAHRCCTPRKALHYVALKLRRWRPDFRGDGGNDGEKRVTA